MMQKESLVVLIAVILVGVFSLSLFAFSGTNTGFAANYPGSQFKVKPIVASAQKAPIAITPISNRYASCRLLHSTCFGAYPVCSRATCRCMSAEEEREEVNTAGERALACIRECERVELECINAGRSNCRDTRLDCSLECSKQGFCQRM